MYFQMLHLYLYVFFLKCSTYIPFCILYFHMQHQFMHFYFVIWHKESGIEFVFCIFSQKPVIRFVFVFSGGFYFSGLHITLTPQGSVASSRFTWKDILRHTSVNWNKYKKEMYKWASTSRCWFCDWIESWPGRKKIASSQCCAFMLFTFSYCFCLMVTLKPA